jgi:hypothetical protein
MTHELRIRGFVPAPDTVTRNGGLARSIDGFGAAFHVLERQGARLLPAEQEALRMGSAERDLSFLNAYFVYQKLE